MENYIGKLLDGRYEILEIIGTGGMAVVYKAKCHRLNRMVAVKILKDEYCRDDEFRRRFQAESQAVAMLSHPNIVAVYDVSKSGDTNYIVMEIIVVNTLKQYMEKKGVLNWRETLHFSMQIGKALEHAHSRGIVHRDIKPHNIMVLKNGSVKVTDFGIARVSSAQSTLTREALGSVHYISPEQAKGGRVDNRSDIYSLGVVMYEMLAGRPPYDGESPVAVAIKHINAGAAMPSIFNSNIPGGLEQITMHAMAAELDERYASATEMLYDLEEFRKNPDILFQFGRGAVARAAQGTHSQPRQPVRQPQGQTADQRAMERARRKRLEEERRRAKQKRIRNAIFAAVAIVLIILVILLAMSSCNGDKEPVAVPNFVNLVFDEIQPEDYPDFRLEEAEREYNDEFEAGRVIRQTPEANDLVSPGTTVELVVSLGEKDDTMPNLAGMKAEAAEKVLKDMDMDLTVRIETEFNDEVEENYVIRTDPGAKTTLTEGQTVTIYVSKGRETLLVQVPNVVGDSLTDAIERLRDAKLDYKVNRVDSDEPKDEVIGQSIDAGEEVKEGTVIVLEVSNGPAEEPDEEDEPDDDEPEPEPDDDEPDPGSDPSPGPDPDPITMVHTITVSDHAEAVTIDVICATTGEICGETQELAPGENAINIALTGTGTMTYNVYVNGEFYSDFSIIFN